MVRGFICQHMGRRRSQGAGRQLFWAGRLRRGAGRFNCFLGCILLWFGGFWFACHIHQFRPLNMSEAGKEWNGKAKLSCEG